MANDLHGYLNVLKPTGWTSHDVVARIRRLAGQRRIGHTGTLDPAAVGVLPIALGRATRTTSSNAWDRKLYWGDVRFGTATDTDDATGRVIATGPTADLDLDDCVAALRGLIGDIQQRPPAYSAVHVGGRRAYAQARRGEVEDLPARPVRIDAVAIVAWRLPTVSLLVQCWSGTYIRSLARDLGVAIGCPSHLGALVRLRVGPFDIRGAVGLEALNEIAEAAAWDRVVWPVDVAAMDLDAIIVGRERAANFLHGRSWTETEPSAPGVPEGLNGGGKHESVRVYDEDGRFFGLAERMESGWQPRLAIPAWDPIAGQVSRL